MKFRNPKPSKPVLQPPPMITPAELEEYVSKAMSTLGQDSHLWSEELKKLSETLQKTARLQANSSNAYKFDAYKFAGKGTRDIRSVSWDAREHDAVMEIVLAAQQWALLEDERRAGHKPISAGEVGSQRLLEAVQAYEVVVGTDAALAGAIGSLLRIKEDLETNDSDGRSVEGFLGDGSS